MIVTDLRPSDILMGRGHQNMMHTGNCYLRELVRSRRREYTSARHRKEKDKIANSVVSAIHEKGGRFLKKIVTEQERKKLNISKGDEAWICVDKSVAVEKVKQNFRDAIPSSHMVASGDERAALSEDKRRESDIAATRRHLLAKPQPAPRLKSSSLCPLSDPFSTCFQENEMRSTYPRDSTIRLVAQQQEVNQRMLLERIQITALLEGMSKTGDIAPSQLSCAHLLWYQLLRQHCQRLTSIQDPEIHELLLVYRPQIPYFSEQLDLKSQRPHPESRHVVTAGNHNVGFQFSVTQPGTTPVIDEQVKHMTGGKKRRFSSLYR